jgi:hypothetical protein
MRASTKRSTVSRKVVDVELRVKADDVRAEQAVEQLDAPWADRERFRIGPRDVPERDDGGLRQALADQARQEGEVVVLHEDDRVVAHRFLHDGVRELRVDRAVLLPVRGAEQRAHVRDVAQRPQSFVGKAFVIARDLLLAQPEPAEVIRGAFGRHCDAVAAIDGLAVGAAAAVRDPRAEHARITGSSAVTSPLAGCCTRMPSAVFTWI